jgi:hypothetical protein
LRPFGTYSDQTRRPSPPFSVPHSAPTARASAVGVSPQPGMPSKPTVTSVSPTLLTTATPFHWSNPAAATS